MFRTIRIALSARRVPSSRFRCGINALRAEVTHFSPGASEAVAMGHFDKKIDVLEAECEKVRKAITSTSMNKGRDIAICTRVVGIGNKVAALRNEIAALKGRPCSRRRRKRGSVEMFVQRVNERRFDEALTLFDKCLVLQMSRDPDGPVLRSSQSRRILGCEGMG